MHDDDRTISYFHCASRLGPEQSTTVLSARAGHPSPGHGPSEAHWQARDALRDMYSSTAA